MNPLSFLALLIILSVSATAFSAEVAYSGIEIPPVYESKAQERLALHPPQISGDEKTDRYGRALLPAPDELINQGLARVQTVRGMEAQRATELYALEKQARTQERGLWADPEFSVRTPENIGEKLNGFQIVEGAVLDAVERRGRIYLNFGADWKTDFTVSMKTGTKKLFSYDPLTLKGKRIRVRGWTEFYNGPMIEVDHPEQIEVL